MPVFQYKAATIDGEIFNGTLNGTSREQVVAQIQSLGQVPIQVDEASQPGQGRSHTLRLRRSRRITDQHITNATRELSTLLRAGLPLDRALSILASLSESERMKELLENVREQVKGGATLADAMQAQEGVFNRFYLNLLRAGEAGGALEVVLERLAEHMEQSQEVRETLVSALIYPAILIFVAVVSIFILLGYVVPQFTELFEGVDQVLPLPTRITIGVGEFLQDFGWVVVLLVAGAAWLVRHQLGQPQGRYQWHARFLKLPLAGSIITKIEVTRFARTLGMLLHNGVPLLKALGIVKDTVDNRVIADGLERVASSLKEGQSLAAPLAEMAHFPAFAVHMIHVGEESGRLEEILHQVALVYERETRTTIKRALSLLEPVLILVLGVIIAGVIISILMAILGINELVF
ncbi:MAG: type II secretion system F family protein [Gammaproteobacteria bacterium]|jgi:general secretion pathway protein F